MEIVVFALESSGTNRSPNQEVIIAISAIRMTVGHLGTMQSFDALAPFKGRLPYWLKPAGLVDSARTEALTRFSRFVGDAWLVAEQGPSDKMPFIHEECLRSRLPTREVRVLDTGDFARKLWDDVCLGSLHDFARRLGLIQDDEFCEVGQKVKLLADVVPRMWEKLSPNFGVCPVGSCTGFLPACCGNESPRLHGLATVGECPSGLVGNKAAARD
jgi:DNA polymerase III alpha subunit (gram-positive type)